MPESLPMNLLFSNKSFLVIRKKTFGDIFERLISQITSSYYHLSWGTVFSLLSTNRLEGRTSWFFTLSWMLIGSSCVSPVSAWPSRPYWRGSTAGCCGSYWPGVGWWCRACPRWAWQGQTPGLPCRERNPDRVGQQPGHSSTEHWLHLLKMLSIIFTIFALTDQIQLLRVRLDVLCVENDEDPASTEGKESPGQLHCGHQPPVNKTSTTMFQLLTSAINTKLRRNIF